MQALSPKQHVPSSLSPWFKGCFYYVLGWGWNLLFSKMVDTFNHVGKPFILFKWRHQGCLNNLIFSKMGLCAAYWACFMCHHGLGLWLTSARHPFSFLNSSLGLAGGKCQKIIIPIFRLIPQNIALPCCFLYILCHSYHFSILSSSWVAIAACGSISMQG